MSLLNKRVKSSLALIAAGVMFLSASSCGVIKMRDSYQNTEIAEGSADVMLNRAERYNTVETMVVTSQEAETKTIKVALSGDIVIDNGIVTDAANRATDGRSYSFIRMFTGIYHTINTADVSFGFFSTADCPEGTDEVTPIECIAALSDLGYDVLDTTGAGKAADELAEYNIVDIDAATDENLSLFEKDGVNFAILSIDNGKIDDSIEYADFVSDILIVSVNWDDSLSDEDKRASVISIAEAGADVIIGSGDKLCGIEWIDTADGTNTLVVNSLGNLICSSDVFTDLCGGILEFSVTVTDEIIELTDVVLTPTVVYYSEGNSDYQIFELESFSDDLSASHMTECVNSENLISYVSGIVSSEFLPESLRK